MKEEKPPPVRFFGLDIHKRYLVATGVDPFGSKVYGPRRVAWTDLQSWRDKTLTSQDAVVIEMTTNTWEVYDQLEPHVHSVTVVHPPHVRLVTEPKVMTDKIAAFNLALLLSKDILKGIWVPPEAVRELRALLAQRNKMTRLSTQAKNRLHAWLHRRHILPGAGDLFHSDRRAWWLDLPQSASEQVRILSDLDTLDFARQQIANLEACLHQIAAGEPRLLLRHEDHLFRRVEGVIDPGAEIGQPPAQAGMDRRQVIERHRQQEQRREGGSAKEEFTKHAAIISPGESEVPAEGLRALRAAISFTRRRRSPLNCSEIIQIHLPTTLTFTRRGWWVSDNL